MPATARSIADAMPVSIAKSTFATLRRSMPHLFFGASKSLYPQGYLVKQMSGHCPRVCLDYVNSRTNGPFVLRSDKYATYLLRTTETPGASIEKGAILHEETQQLRPHLAAQPEH